MTEFILSNIGALLWAAGALAVAVFGAFMKRAGRNAEKAKQVAKDLSAAQDRLEMHREATEFEREAQRLSDEAALKEAMKWPKR